MDGTTPIAKCYSATTAPDNGSAVARVACVGRTDSREIRLFDDQRSTVLTGAAVSRRVARAGRRPAANNYNESNQIWRHFRTTVKRLCRQRDWDGLYGNGDSSRNRIDDVGGGGDRCWTNETVANDSGGDTAVVTETSLDFERRKRTAQKVQKFTPRAQCEKVISHNAIRRKSKQPDREWTEKKESNGAKRHSTLIYERTKKWQR